MNDDVATYYDMYKKIRNKLNLYDGESIVFEVALYLKEATESPVAQAQKFPWLCMLLIKWAALETNFVFKNPVRIPRYILLQQLNRMIEMQSKARGVASYDHYTILFRNMAFQQFWYQHDVESYRVGIARQSILFSSLETNHTLRRRYEERFGITIETTLVLEFALWVFFCIDEMLYIRTSDFGLLIPIFGTKIDRFIENLACDREQLRNALTRESSGRREASEYYEQTPLLQFPLFKLDQTTYLSYEKHVIGRSLQSFFYDTFRASDPQWFMERFGNIFERYVERGLIQLRIEYLTELQLRHLFGPRSKVVDFYIPAKGIGVLIDAKGVETSSTAKTTHLSEVIRHDTKSSILKAFDQAFDVVTKLEEIPIEESHLRRNEYFLLVVTYKEFYLGTGEYFAEVIAKHEIERKRSAYPHSDKLPNTNIFFLSIDEYDLLIGILEKGLRIEDVLSDIVSAESKPESKQYEFSQHLYSFNAGVKYPSYLSDELQRIGNILESK